jgi:fatty acid-binding protein DegV
MTVIDTGAASGRLGLMVLETVRYAAGYPDQPPPDFGSVCAFARSAIHRCQEYLFPDRLRYLAAGGRLPRSKAWFGDLLRMKPVISPRPEGVHKAGVARDADDQIAFALERLRGAFGTADGPRIMLEYSDNREWVETEVAGRVREILPTSEILLQPLSLTSGVHMGPGTWGIAFMPAERGAAS